MPSTRACGASHLPRDNGCSLRELKSLNVGIRAKRVSRTELTRIKHWRFTINPESDALSHFAAVTVSYFTSVASRALLIFNTTPAFLSATSLT
jgi:hypothetical protein